MTRTMTTYTRESFACRSSKHFCQGVGLAGPRLRLTHPFCGNPKFGVRFSPLTPILRGPSVSTRGSKKKFVSKTTNFITTKENHEAAWLLPASFSSNRLMAGEPMASSLCTALGDKVYKTKPSDKTILSHKWDGFVVSVKQTLDN